MQQALKSKKLALRPEFMGRMDKYLNRCEDGSNVISWAPAALQNVQTEASIVIDVRMKHFAHKLDGRSLVRVGFIKFHGKFEYTIFKGRFGRSMQEKCIIWARRVKRVYPKMTADQDMMLSGSGEALIPSGGSSCILSN